MRISLKRIRPDIRPRRQSVDELRLHQARRQAWLEGTRPRINL